jgi:hypothetical protein
MGVTESVPAVGSGAVPAARSGVLPEVASVYWRPRASEVTLARAGKLWTLLTVGHTVPFLAAAALLSVLSPAALPVALAALAQAWLIPELYAARGANVLRPRAPTKRRDAEANALGLLGDLIGHDARALQTGTGLVLEMGEFGAWLLAEAGAVLVRPGGRRVHCYCVKATDPELPSGDRIAHLLLALRSDESGFATVANVAFCGARWRLRRRLGKRARPALDSAVAAARGMA